MARSAIKKTDLKKHDKLKKEIERQQKELREIESGIESSIGSFVCEKFGTHDLEWLEEKINYYYDLEQIENAAKGDVAKNEVVPEYDINRS
ncbi:hypothetical protein EVJ32_10720 [Exiguobacterium sp. SH5S4]|uniref:hypothetical protein n=1 Tax=Exiguobacterium sp. SH5S4 TaxID=2510961 RepID=UPI00103A2EB1|nr:hypothetical protein [Exiguobacterium sp. SH5S4]TCI25265.1 hypothetical protein EVJ32_10720 [Exiguobacterium sp. SH5S4]